MTHQSEIMIEYCTFVWGSEQTPLDFQNIPSSKAFDSVDGTT